MEAIPITPYTCKRCGHSWFPRMKTIPTVCPGCKSPYWNKERTQKKGVTGVMK